MKTFMTIVILATLVAGTNQGLAESTSPPLSYVPSPEHVIVKQAMFFAVPAREIIQVGMCESGLDQSRIGKAGEIGAFQYFQSTWDDMSAAMGEKLDIHSFYDQAKLTTWVFANRPEWKRQWSTWQYWYGTGHHKCHS